MSRGTGIERVRRLCAALPETSEKIAWGEPTFRVRDRMFAMYAGAGQHGAGSDSVWLKAPIGMQELLVRSDSETYFSPPYVGVKGWIGVRVDRISDEALLEHITESYAMVAPRRLLAVLDRATAQSPARP